MHLLALSTSFNYKAVYEYKIYKKRRTRPTGIHFIKQIIPNLYFLRLRFGLGLRSGSLTVRSSSGASTGRSSHGTTTRTDPRLVKNLKKKNKIFSFFGLFRKFTLFETSRNQASPLKIIAVSRRFDSTINKSQ